MTSTGAGATRVSEFSKPPQYVLEHIVGKSMVASATLCSVTFTHGETPYV